MNKLLQQVFVVLAEAPVSGSEEEVITISAQVAAQLQDKILEIVELSGE